ncbi:MAG TPA: branched-chain amino acid ABC transporter permease [Casimicrobiaceae bacterium]|jgi:branched-chain amino acid transport system permease protein|nr:branched-chain amino acid ABC transporter permease [Casimicrobiaceae bacterium]
MTRDGDADGPRIAPAAALRQWALAQRLWFGAAALLLVLPFVPGLDTNFGRSLLSQMGIAAVFALSYNLLLGQTGLLSFGHAVYFGLGAYAGIHLMRAINGGVPIPMPLVPIAGAVTGLAFGMLFGALTTRRAGVVFALISLGVGELVLATVRLAQGFSGGEEGITANRSVGPHPFGLTFASQLQVYYVIVLWALLAAALMVAFLRTPVGRLCNAVRDNPVRTEFIGYDPVRVRFIAFSAAAMFAGLAGGLHALNYEIVAAEAVGAGRSGAVLLMAYIGGIGHFLGAILGAIVITWLQVSLSDYTTAWQLYLGLFFMAVVLFAPGGLAGLLLMHVPLLRNRGWVGVLKAYTIALLPALVMLAGAATLLEINYRRATQPEAGPRVTLLGVTMDTSTPWPWLTAIVLVITGFYAFRRSWPLVAAAWRHAGSEARAQSEGRQ